MIESYRQDMWMLVKHEQGRDKFADRKFSFDCIGELKGNLESLFGRRDQGKPR